MHSTTATYATLRKERRMKPTDQAALHWKSGGAEWRDPQFAFVDTPLLLLLRMAITEVDLAKEASRLLRDNPSKLQISPLRFAPVEMTKGRVALPLTVVAGNQKRAFSLTSVGQRPIPLSGRHHKGKGRDSPGSLRRTPRKGRLRQLGIRRQRRTTGADSLKEPANPLLQSKQMIQRPLPFPNRIGSP
jgi:hypothetical protein